MSQQQEHTVRTDDGGQLQTELRQLAQEIAASLSDLDAASGRALVSDFVSELFFQLAEQQRREDRRQKQAQGIAAAKARGVRFGRPAVETPEDFGALVEAWERHERSFADTIALCGMSEATFYRRLREYRIERNSRGK